MAFRKLARSLRSGQLVHPHAAGRIYAAYGGVYVGVAIFWLGLVDAARPTTTDLVGVAISLVGMAVIVMGAQQQG